MTPDQIMDDFKLIAEHYGIDEECNQLMEECAELIQALNKLHRATGNGLPTPYSIVDAKEKVKEEITDVLIAIVQVRHLLNISDNEIYLQADFKLKRTKARRYSLDG